MIPLMEPGQALPASEGVPKRASGHLRTTYVLFLTWAIVSMVQALYIVVAFVVGSGVAASSGMGNEILGFGIVVGLALVAVAAVCALAALRLRARARSGKSWTLATAVILILEGVLLPAVLGIFNVLTFAIAIYAIFAVTRPASDQQLVNP